MADRIQPGSYFQYSPSGGGGGGGHHHASPHRLPSSPSLDRETNSRYLAELLAERQKLGPFLQVLPLCSRLLNQEIVRASGLSLNQAFLDYESPLRSTVQNLNSGLMDLEGWPIMHPEENGFLQRNGVFQSPPIGWHGSPGVTSNRIVKRVIRLDIPVDKFPMFNFVGRLLGPRGNSLKRVEATTGCRVYIRGRGSVKDTIQEDKLRDKPGYEHLNDPLHVLVEAEFPIDVIDSHLNQAVAILEDLLKPMDESMDFYKKEQLRELALLNGTLREESPSMSPSMSPFNSTAGMKRAKTGL